MDFIIEYNNRMLQGQEIIKEVLDKESTVYVKEIGQHNRTKRSKT